MYREGTDLDELLAELDAQYPHRVRVLEIARPREGGVLGFFAKQRVGVHYMLTSAGDPEQARAAERYDADADAAPSPQERPAADQAADRAAQRDSHFQQILAELSRRQAGNPPDTGQRGGGTAERGDAERAFTRPRDLAPGDAPASPEQALPARFEPITPAMITLPQARAGRVAGADAGALVAVGSAAVDAAAVDAAVLDATALAASGADTDTRTLVTAGATARPRRVRPPDAPASARGQRALLTRMPLPDTPERVHPQEAHPHVRPTHPTPDPRPLAVRRQLLELGVPVDRLPPIIVDARTAIADLVATLPPAPVPPTEGGQILVVTGPARDVVTAADVLTRGQNAPFDSAWTFECPLGPRQGEVVAPNRAITSIAQASALAQQWRSRAEKPVLVAVATDGPTWRQRSATVIAELQADAVWAVVDATRKPDDTRRALGGLTRVDGIIVVNGRHTSSPASVWGIDKPIALLNGRRSTPTAWTVLLESKLAEMEQECSVAPY
ncbi:MAG: hypothetical protein BGO26_16305 [Actinobacteria bacterium 69-20]|nr:MAG: hypothetical protein BGO26_16305 [Actinobacteria bacterium 69-20]